MFNLHYNIQRYEDTVKLFCVNSIALRTNEYRIFFANAKRQYYTYLKSIALGFYMTCHPYERGIAHILQNELSNRKMVLIPVFNDTVLRVINKNSSIAFHGTLNEKMRNYG